MLDKSSQFKEALRLMEKTNEHVLITGRAGTGKSTLLNYFREHSKKNVVVLAPTGVAAVNVQGQTIHSFFGFFPDITIAKAKKAKPRNKELYKQVDTIVIDEISMVRADLLDCIDVFLRKWGKIKGMAFGGVQMIFIGDLYQLPPVVSRAEVFAFAGAYESPYFFSSDVMNQRQQAMLTEPFSFSFIELEKVYRQKEDFFVDLLNAVRNNTITDIMIDTLNQRALPHATQNKKERYITLTTTNAMAEEENAVKLATLPTASTLFSARVNGDVQKEMYPADTSLEIKPEAQVMMLNNDTQGRWINGTIGKVVRVLPAEADEHAHVIVRLEDGEEVEVGPHQWDVFEFSYDTSASSIVSETVGTFVQYPMRLAWAVTIHKAQGKTFDHVVVDMGRGAFATGQTYVALSRCTSFDGLILRRPIRASDVRIDPHIVDFVTSCHYTKAEKEYSLEDKVAVLEKAVEKKHRVRITYLQSSDEKSERIIIPESVGEMEYQGEVYIGVRAYCETSQMSRIFRVRNILAMDVVKGKKSKS
jgi:ATP-dependent DNA helicase PIF1